MNKKNITAKELSNHFEVSQRTIYRDIDILCQSGIPIYTNKGKGGGICLMENYVLNKSLLTEQEQNDILSALQGLKATSLADTEHVLTKLNSIFGSKNFDWIKVDFSNWSTKEEDRIKFQQLKDSILNCQVIQFQYNNSYGQESQRIVEPIKLVFRGQSWYLYGLCRSKVDYRYFKITRMRYLNELEETFPYSSVNRNTSPVTPYESTQKTISVVLKLDSAMAYRLYDEFPQESIHKEVDGSYIIHTELQDNNWLYGYLMSFEDHLEIIEPVYVRETLLSKFKNASKKNII
jgi:predicted DNA-binding transcriptional regulator YafY